MSAFPFRRQWFRAGLTGATILLACTVCDCGSSSLKSPQLDGNPDLPGSGWTGGDPLGGTADAAGGMVSVPGSGGNSGQGASTTATGGGLGGQGAVDAAGGDGGAVGGHTGTAGRTGTGANGGAGGTTGIDGATSSGGRTGGFTGSAGRTGGGGTTGGMGGGIDGPPSQADIMLQPLAKAFCAAARTCCARDGYYKMDLNDCEAKLPARLNPYPLLDQGAVNIDPTRLAACVSAYQKAATTCTATEVDAACQGVWLGTRSDGQSCGGTIAFGAFDCQATNGSAACYWEDTESYPGGAGVCVSLPRGKAGDPCSKSCRAGQDCIVDLVGASTPLSVMCFEEDGLYCAVAANPPICKSFLKVGDPCTYDPGCCGRGNYCNWNQEVCQVAAKLGESCGEVECADGLACASGLRCAELTLVSDKVCLGTPALP